MGEDVKFVSRVLCEYGPSMPDPERVLLTEARVAEKLPITLGMNEI
jgi:hypothetical protein